MIHLGLILTTSIFTPVVGFPSKLIHSGIFSDRTTNWAPDGTGRGLAIFIYKTVFGTASDFYLKATLSR